MNTKSGEIMPNSQKATFRDFPFTYYIAIIFEFFERGSYYGVMSILSVYMTDQLGFAKTDVGLIKGTIQPLLYFLPILTGAIADRMGYRKTLMIAFSLLGLGYLATSQVTDYNAVFISLVVMGIGAGTFKPVISGTIAKVTDERTSTLGFGIFYWTINLGAFLFPLILVPILKSMDWSYVLIAAGICTGAMLLPTIFIYKEPVKEDKKDVPFAKMLEEVFLKIWLVLKDWRFILFVFIYSWFWILYFQMFDSVLWYVKAFVDPAPLNAFVNSLFGTNWKFDIEHVTVINAGTIIMLQLWISSLVKNTRALPTMLVGIAMATCGMAILSLGTSIWIFLIGIIIFSTGEMTAHPKFISYLGLLAPEDKKATYMGFGFLYGVFGSFFGGIIGANLYVSFIDKPMIAFVGNKMDQAGQSGLISVGDGVDAAIKAAESIGLGRAEIHAQADPSSLWLVFSSIGVLCIVGLLAYQRYITKK